MMADCLSMLIGCHRKTFVIRSVNNRHDVHPKNI